MDMRFLGSVMASTTVAVVVCTPDEIPVPSDGIVRDVVLIPHEWSVDVAAEKEKLTLASTSQSPAVKESVNKFKAVPVESA